MKLYNEGKHIDVENLVNAVSVKELLPHLQKVFENPSDSGPGNLTAGQTVAAADDDEQNDDDGSDFGGSDEGSVVSFGEREDADGDGQSDDEDGLFEKQKRYIYVDDGNLDQFSDIDVNDGWDPTNSDQFLSSEDDIYGTDHAAPLATAACAIPSSSTFSTSSKGLGCPNTPTVCKSWPRCRCLRCIEGRGCCYVCRYYYKCDCGQCGFANGAVGDDTRIVGDHIVAALDDEMLRWQGRGSWTARYEYVKERVEGKMHAKFSLMPRNQCLNLISGNLSYYTPIACVTDSSNPAKWRYDWKVGRLDDSYLCCHEAFVKFYGTSTGSVEKMIRELKAKRYGQPAQKLNPRTLVDKDLAEEMERDCSQIYGFQLSEELLQAAHGRESHAWNCLLAWFKAFIDRECEPQPNRKGERHLL
jgi:hypothetical protein